VIGTAMRSEEASQKMLQGCTTWSEESASRYRQQGYWADITLYDMLLRSVGVAPDKIALVHDARRLSYAQLGHAIDRLAHHLLDLGFRPLDRVVSRQAFTPIALHPLANGARADACGFGCKIACNIDPLRGLFASNSDPL